MKVISIKTNPIAASTSSIMATTVVACPTDTVIEKTTKSTEIQDILNACENRQNLSDESSQLRFPGISEILPTLYLCGAGVAIPSIMEKLDIKCVVNVAPELPDTPLPNNKPVYLRVNVYDRRDADLKSYFDEVVDLIEEVRQSNGKSLVHCVAGVSRSASLCIAYLMKYMKMTLRDSYLHVKNARPQIRPNLGFFQQLLEYEEEIHGEKSVKMIFVKSLDREIPDVFEPEYRAMEEFYQKCRRHYETIRR